MISPELEDFLAAWCNIDADPDETIALLHGPSKDYFLSWLPRELEAAVRSRSLNPAVLTDLTTFAFRDQTDVDSWVRDRWAEWFTEPYPL